MLWWGLLLLLLLWLLLLLLLRRLRGLGGGVRGCCRCGAWRAPEYELFVACGAHVELVLALKPSSAVAECGGGDAAVLDCTAFSNPYSE